MPDKDKRKALYDAVSKDYDLGSYDDFSAKMDDSTKRKAFYNGVGKEYELGDYNSFESNVSIKKKDSGIASPPPSATTTPTTSGSKPFLPGSSIVPEDKIIKMPEMATDETAHDNDPIRTALQPHRNEYTKTLNEYNNSGVSQRNTSESTGQRVKPDRIPIAGKQSYEATISGKLNNHVKSIYNTYDAVTNQVVPDVQSAKKVLQSIAEKNNGQIPEDNETAQVAAQKVNDFTEREKNIGESGGDLTTAAINQGMQENPHLAKEIETIKKEHPNATNLKDILPGSMVGKLVDNFYKDKDNRDVISHHPEWQKQFEETGKNNLTDNPEYGAVVVGNELSRARHAEGKNNFFANAVFSGHSEYMDDLAKRLYKDDPQKMQIYNDIVRKDYNKYIDTKDFMSSFAEGGKGVFKGIKNTAKELTGQGSDAQSAYNDLKEQNEQVSSGAKGIYEYTDPAGKMSGMIAAMIGTGGILKGIGLGEKLANGTNVASTFWGDEKGKFRLKYPGEPLKQNLGSILMTTAYMAAPNAVPSNKISKVLNAVRPEMESITEQLASGSLTKAAAKSKAQYAFEQALKFGKTTGTQLGKGTAEMTAITAFGQGLDKALGLGDSQMDKFHPKGELEDVAKSMLIGNAIPSLFMGAMGIRSRPYTKESLYEMARNPNRFLSVIHDQALSDPIAKDKLQLKKDDIEHLVRTKDELDSHTSLTTEQKKQYILQDYNEKLLKQRAEGITNEFLKGKIDDQIKKAAAIKESIFKGKGTDILPQEDHLTSKEYKEVSDIKNDDDLFNYFVGQKKEGYKTTLKAAEDMEDKKAGVKAGLDYMKDKAIENPVLFRQTWGNDITDKMFDKATIQEIGDSYHNLIDHDSNDPAIPILEKKLDEREAKGEVYKPAKTEEPSNEEAVTVIQPAKESAISVIKPGEIKHPETITIKPKEDAVEIKKSDAVDVREQTTDGKGMGEGNSEPPIPPGKEKVLEGAGEEEDLTRLTHADTEQIYKEAGLPERLETPTKHFEQLKQEAEAKLQKGYDYEDVAKKTMEGKYTFEDSDQLLFARRVADLKAKQKGMDVTSKEFDAAQNEIERLSRASDVAGTISGRALQARKNYLPTEASISDDLMQRKQTLGVDQLTDKQKEETAKLFTDEEKATKEYDEKMAKLEAENAKLRAEQEVKKMRSKSPEKMTHEERTAQRKKSLEDARAALLRVAKGEGGAMSAIPGLPQLIAIAPHVKDYAKSLIAEGIDNLPRIVEAIHKEFKNILDGITEKDIHNIIAGEYDQKKATRNQLAVKMHDLKTEAELINKLERIQSGEEPKSEKKKVERNKQIKDLRDKISSYRKDEREANKFYGEELTDEAKNLNATKKRIQAQIQKVEEQIQKGDFSKAEVKPELKLDKEAIDLKDKLVEARKRRALAKLQDFYENQSKYEKGMRYAAEVLNVPRAIMSSTDFSAVLRQGIIPSASHPLMSGSAAKEMFKAAVSQKTYDRWFYDLSKTPRYEDMMKTGLGITDSTNPHLAAREELFMSNLAEKVPLIGESIKRNGKTIVPGLGLVKGSERAYSMYLNKIRVDLYNRFADQMERRGLTIKNSPEQYKQLSQYINNATGRGSVNKAIEPAIPLLNSVFFSPRLIASRLNMLSYWAQPRFYKSVPAEVRKAYFRDMAAFVGVGMTVLALAKLNGLEVESDPRSSDFGKIKSGNSRWDIWGGFQPYARTAAQVISGQRKSTNTGKMYELDGKGAFGQSRGNVVSNFFRGKLAPVPGLAVDMMSGRDMVGNKIVYKWKGGEKEKGISDILKTNLLPMTATGMEEALKDQGTKAWFTVGVPSLFGVGTATYDAQKKKK